MLFFSLGVALDESNLSSLLHCVCDGLLLGGPKFFCPFPSVHELPLVMFISLGATLDELNTLSFVLVMVLFLMFLNFPWCGSFLGVFYPFPSGSNLPKFLVIHTWCFRTWNCGVFIGGQTTKLLFM